MKKHPSRKSSRHVPVPRLQTISQAQSTRAVFGGRSSTSQQDSGVQYVFGFWPSTKEAA